MMVDDAHPILMVLQLHVPFVRMASYLRRYAKPSRPSVKHAVTNVQVHIEKQKRSEDANNKNLPQQTRMYHHITSSACPFQSAHARISGTTQKNTTQRNTKQKRNEDCPGFPNSTGRLGPKRGGPQRRGQNQKSKPTPGVTMMHHATKCGFKDCPEFLNSTGRLGPKRGRKCYVTPAFSGVPNKGDKIRSQNLRRGSP